MSSIQQRLTDLLAPVVQGQSCELWGIEFFAQGKKSILRIYIDKPEGVELEDCERVSRQVSAVMDVEDPIRTEYTLEVSSPGMDRPLFTLAQFQDSVGEHVAVRLRVGFEGRRNFSGQFTGIENEELILVVDKEEYVLPYELVDKANIVPQF